MSIHDFPSRNGGLDGGNEPPHDDGMGSRVTKLEDFVIDARDRLTRIETRLDQTATKSDLHESSNSHIKWIVGTAAGLGVALITVMSVVLNNAIPKALSYDPVSSAPVIIYSQPTPAALVSLPQTSQISK
jgi:hypothetical protein